MSDIEDRRHYIVIQGEIIQLFIPSGAKKGKSLITELDDLKEFKKTLRTKTNLLVAFAKSGITPQGAISFISNSWGGRTSDKHLTEHCGFLDVILPGDLVLADRGFDIAASVGTLYVQVNIPAFTRGKSQMSPIDLETSRKLAKNVRIHVERVIGLTRQKYTILNSNLPIEFLETRLNGDDLLIDKIVLICCALVNLCESIVNFD